MHLQVGMSGQLRFTKIISNERFRGAKVITGRDILRDTFLSLTVVNKFGWATENPSIYLVSAPQSFVASRNVQSCTMAYKKYPVSWFDMTFTPPLPFRSSFESSHGHGTSLYTINRVVSPSQSWWLLWNNCVKWTDEKWHYSGCFFFFLKVLRSELQLWNCRHHYTPENTIRARFCPFWAHFKQYLFLNFICGTELDWAETYPSPFCCL